MKKIAMFTMGTRGDIQPYIFLARGLVRNGYDVVLGSHPCWKDLVENAGIHFEPIGPDIDIEKEAAVIRGKNQNPALSMLKTMNFVFRIIQDSTHEIYEVCKGQDLIVVSHSQMGATEAEALGIPIVNVTLQKEMIPEKRKPQTLKDKLLGGMIGKQMAKPYNKIRKVYGLAPVKSSDEILSQKLNLIPISKYVLERNPYWEDHHILTGYWYEEDTDYIPDEKLVQFLESGEKPVILALGAMSFEDTSEKDKLDMFVNAFQRAGCRAIIQGFQKTLKDYELPDTMIACGSVPHSWLFGQGCFVIHHCGFGTAAASMIYGIPSIPVPHVLDQMGFAKQLCDMHVATKPIQAGDLSETAIYEAIREMQTSFDEKKRNAQAISEKIRNEGGVAEAVRLINMNIKQSIDATRKGFEDSFSSGVFYNKQTQDAGHLEQILRFLPIKQDMTILDLGAGSGYLSFPIAKENSNCKVVGLDIVSKALEVNRERADKENMSNLSFVCYDGIDFPFADASFDMVISRYALHHFPDIEHSIGEVSRVLKKNGYFFVSDPCPNDCDSSRFVDEYMQMKKDGHIKFYTKKEWEDICSEFGMEMSDFFESSIRFPRKRDTAYGFDELLKKHEQSIIDSYDLVVTDTEIYVTERVNNILFSK